MNMALQQKIKCFATMHTYTFHPEFLQSAKKHQLQLSVSTGSWCAAILLLQAALKGFVPSLFYSRTAPYVFRIFSCTCISKAFFKTSSTGVAVHLFEPFFVAPKLSCQCLILSSDPTFLGGLLCLIRPHRGQWGPKAILLGGHGGVRWRGMSQPAAQEATTNTQWRGSQFFPSLRKTILTA